MKLPIDKFFDLFDLRLLSEVVFRMLSCKLSCLQLLSDLIFNIILDVEVDRIIFALKIRDGSGIDAVKEASSIFN
jgi:hypothetical protein